MVTSREVLHRYPFLRLSIPVIFAIYFGISGKLDFSIPFPVIAFLFLAILFIPYLSRKVFSFRTRWISGVMIFLMLFILSFEISRMSTRKISPEISAKIESKEKILIADISEPVVQGGKTARVILRILAYRENRVWKDYQEKVIAYVQRDESSDELFYGDRIIFRGQLTEPGYSGIPGSFDYKRYLNMRGIFMKTMIKKGQWMKISRNNQNKLLYQALILRDKLLEMLRQQDLGKREFGVASALLLGYVNEIDHDLMKDYSAAGVMHVLSVSGMHVGMIFLALEKLLGFLNRRKHGKIIKVILSLFLIWCYAMITGLSPAVLRASAMLTLVIIGNSMKRDPDTFNILAASFIFIVILEPKLLMDMGFQLSYLAVAGIIILNQPIYEWINFTNPFFDKVWSLIAVSVAAQVITAPLCLYYFHQFPNYFLAANLVVVPLANLIIYCGILGLICNGVPLVSVILSKLSSWSLGFLNDFIHFAGSLPGAVTSGIHISLHEAVIIYGILIALLLYMSKKKKRWIFFLLLLLISLQGSFLVKKINRYRISNFIVYGVRKSLLFDCIGNGTSILAGDMRNLENPFVSGNLKEFHAEVGSREKYRFLFLPDIINEKSFKDPGNFFKRGRFIQFHQKRIGILEQKIPPGKVKKLKLDYLILSGNPKVRVAEIVQIYEVKRLIFDNSNYRGRVMEWVKEAEELNLPCHSVYDQGPFIEDFY